MNNIKLQTLTHVHIGSGNLLYHNNDFVVDTESGETFLYVIDPAKILEIVGADKIDTWVHQIERGENTKDFIKNICRNSHPKDYSLRAIQKFFESKIKQNDTIKECIHDGMGRAYIPGSSLKGGIRTAIMASLAPTENISNLVNIRENRNGKLSIRANEKDLFGLDPNSDIFRFIKVGDAYFDDECEIATRMININIRERDTLTDESKPQIVEAIPYDCETTLQLKIDSAYYDWAKRRWPQLGNMPEEIRDIPSLFRVINHHTKKLVANDITFWKNRNETGADDYIQNMTEILQEISSCIEGGNHECVLRIGHASGWKFITGAWSENHPYFNSKIIPATRPKNNIYSNYDFPKTRRLDEDSNILGFIKLSLL